MDKKLFSHCCARRTLNSLRMALASSATEHRVCPFADHYCATWLFITLIQLFALSFPYAPYPNHEVHERQTLMSGYNLLAHS